MSTMIRVRATVERDGRWWLVRVPEYDIVGQATKLADAESVASEITALWLDLDPDSIAVTMEPLLPTDAQHELEEATVEERQARNLAADAAHRRTVVVRNLLSTGMSQIEAATLLGVSRQRVAQLSKGTH